MDANHHPQRWPGDEVRTPRDCELYGHGQIEVPTSDCEPPQGLRGLIDSPPSMLPETQRTWEPNPPPAVEMPESLPTPEAGARATRSGAPYRS
jgi:hypothetical protein